MVVQVPVAESSPVPDWAARLASKASRRPRRRPTFLILACAMRLSLYSLVRASEDTAFFRI